MKKILILLLSLCAALLPICSVSANDVNAFAKYDMNDIDNGLKNSVNPGLYDATASLLKINDYIYDTNYKTSENGTVKIPGVGVEFNNSWTVACNFIAAKNTGEVRIMSVASPSKQYMKISNGNGVIALIISLINEDGTEKSVCYRSTSTVSAGWNKLVISYNRENMVPQGIMNGKTMIFGEAVTSEYGAAISFDTSGYSCSEIPEEVTAYFNGTHTNHDWGGALSRYCFGGIAMYNGAADEQKLEEIASEDSGRYETSYDLELYQDTDVISYAGLKTDIDESKDIIARIVIDKTDYLTDDIIYLRVAGEETVVLPYSIDWIDDTNAKVKFKSRGGEYELVISKELKDSSDAFIRKNDYILGLSIKVNEAYRSEILNSIRNPDINMEDFLASYGTFLNISCDNYNKCIGKDKINMAIIKYASETPDMTIDDIKTEFEDLSLKQINLDYVDAVSEYNNALKNTLADVTEYEEIVMNKYASCFCLDDDILTLYSSLSDKSKMWSKLIGKNYDDPEESIDQIIQTVKTDIANACNIRAREEAFERLDSASRDNIDSIIRQIKSTWQDVPIDLENEEYVLYKDSVITFLSTRELSDTSIEKEFYISVLAAGLNNVSAGDRERVSKLMDQYGKYVDLPADFTNMQNKLPVYKKMIGKKYDPDNIPGIITQCVDAVKSDILSGGGSGSGSGGGTGSGSGGGSFSYTAQNCSPAVSENDEKIVIKPTASEEEKLVFTDISTYEWAKESIYGLVHCGGIKGVGNNKFEPSKTVMREEFVKMIVCAFDITGDGNIEFNDVTESDWCYEYIQRAVDAELISGVGDNIFGKETEISRQDMAVILYRVLDVSSENEKTEEVVEDFKDGAEIAEYASKAVRELRRIGIINGNENGYFNPTADANRAEAAKMIYSLKKYMGVNK